MNKAGILIVGSFVVGVGTGYLLAVERLKKKYEAIADAEIELFRRAFLLPANDRFDKEPTEAEDYDPSANFRSVPSHLVRSSLEANKPNKSELAKKDYQIYKPVQNKPVISTVEEMEEVLTEAMSEDTTLEDGKPYPITDQQYLEECDDFTKMSLIYYPDGVLMSEDEEMVDDIAHTIGHDAFAMLTTSIRGPVWARNAALEVDYEIIIMQQPYGEMMDTPPDHGSMRRRHQDEDDED